MESAKKSFAVIMGTRPNFVKAAPFFHRGKDYDDINLTSIHTGQHFDQNMSQVFFEQMGIPEPDIFLESSADLYSEKMGKMFSGLGEIFEEHKFDGCILFGDVNSTLAGAIAAANNNCPIFHIEAGLRSHDKRMPEETNRVIVDHLASFLFTTEESANENLKKEGVDEKKVKFVGNIMIESLEFFANHINNSNILREVSVKAGKYVVVTLHRQENTSHIPTFKKILKILSEVAEDTQVVFPIHPGTKKKIEENNLTYYLKNMTVINPVGYLDFVKLTKEAGGVVTDSGGIQEETTHLGVPCCTIRDNTERPITLNKGTNKLFPIKELNSSSLLDHLSKGNVNSNSIPLWDDQVSKRIFDILQTM